MMHFSCDFCGKDMSAANSCRYVVKMEVFAAHDLADLIEDDLDADHLQEIGQLLQEEGPDLEPVPSCKKLRYDLCPNCHKKFMADPLGREVMKFDFSAN